jgi:hypothetical protein
MSSASDRLLLIHEAFSKAYDRRSSDLKSASTNAEADQILQNVDELETQYLLAARRALDGNSDAIEAAYEDAKAAQHQVDDAYSNAKALPARIRLVTAVAKNIGQLVTKATRA